MLDSICILSCLKCAVYSRSVRIRFFWPNLSHLRWLAVQLRYGSDFAAIIFFLNDLPAMRNDGFTYILWI